MANEPSRGGPRQPLSARQVEVLRARARWRSYQEVGLALGISPRTVEEHVANIKRALGAESTAEMILLGVEMGYVVLGLGREAPGGPRLTSPSQ